MYGLNAVRVMLTSTSSAIATRRRRITSTVTGSSAGAPSGAWLIAMSAAAVNVDLLEPADREAVARADQGARAVLLDQRRAMSRKPGCEREAVEDGSVEEAVLIKEIDRPCARRGGVRMAGAVGEAHELRPRHVQRCERMQRHELRFRGRIGMAVAARVFAVERAAQRRGIVALRQRDLERMLLALVANLGLARERDLAGAELAPQRGAA